MDDKPVMSPYVWILALAIATLGSFIFSAWQYNEMQSAIGILALVDKKGADDIGMLQQELASQRATIESLKMAASGAKAAPAQAMEAAPAAVPAAAPAAASAKAKPHR